MEAGTTDRLKVLENACKASFSFNENDELTRLQMEHKFTQSERCTAYQSVVRNSPIAATCTNAAYQALYECTGARDVKNQLASFCYDDVDKFRDKDGFTAFGKAVSRKDFEVASILLMAGADMDFTTSNGNTMLIQYSHVPEIFRYLAFVGADMNVLNNRGRTALMNACENGKDAIIQSLLSVGADATVTNSNGDTALSLYRSSSFASFEALVAAGAHVKSAPSVLANCIDNEQMFELALSLGADANGVDENGRTVLMKACDYNDINIAKLLLEAGADVNTQDKLQRTALMIACGTTNDELILCLLNAGADVNVLDVDGGTALMHYYGSNYDTFNAFLNAGADINHQDKDGNTVLTMCIECDDPVSTMECLIDCGVDMAIRNKAGKSAYDLSKQRNANGSVKKHNHKEALEKASRCLLSSTIKRLLQCHLSGVQLMRELYRVLHEDMAMLVYANPVAMLSLHSLTDAAPNTTATTAASTSSSQLYFSLSKESVRYLLRCMKRTEMDRLPETGYVVMGKLFVEALISLD